jgi:N-ethylmaleimide reductase
MSSHERLLSPITLGAWRLRNRIAMAPMTRSRAGAGGVPTTLNARYYAQRAGAGLIVAEATQISPEAQGYPRTPGIYAPEQIRGWRAVTDAVHERGGTILLQLWHVGRCTHPENRQPGTRGVAPSAIAAPGRIFTPGGLQPMPVPVALDRAGIDDIVAGYAQAAANAITAGFDGVELHAANGYLVDQFLHSSSNLRTDEYGGSIANRCRLLREVTVSLADRIGADRVGVRLSPFGVFNGAVDDDPASLFAAAIEGLNSLGIAYLHVINVEVSGDRAATGASVDAVAFSRRHWKGSLIAAGGYTPDSAEAALMSGKADLVAFGRPFIANPDLVERIRSGRAWAEPQRATFYTEGEAGYTDYPVADPLVEI